MSNAAEAPTFNHVALTVAPDTLDQDGRDAILRFYGDVFGWDEMPTLTKDRELLVLRARSNEQFVFLQASDQPMRCAGGEHFGMSVATPAELDALFERARSFRERDPDVEIVDRKIDDFTAVKLHSFYVRYRLPMMIEVQCFEWMPGFDAGSRGG
jgi:hypothetical protein